MQKRQKAVLRRRRRLTLLLVILLLLGLGFVTVWKGFVVKKVSVEGNSVYSDEQIKEWVLNDEYSWNSLYVYLKNKLRKPGEVPFVDSMEITLNSPQEVQIHVIEKGMLGYVYIPEQGQNAYFDKDGFVVELSPEIIEGVMQIKGLSVGEVALYEKLNLENTNVLQTLLTVTQLLKKYEQEPELLTVQDRGILLDYGKIQVNLGMGDYLSEKILRMQQLLPKLDGKSGILHLETWTKNSTDVFFEKKNK